MSLFKEIRENASLSTVFVLANGVQVVIATTDVIMASWIGIDALAASTLAQAYFYVIYLVGLGLMISITPFVSEALLRKEHDSDIRAVFTTSMQIIVFLGISAMIALSFTTDILHLLGQDPHLVLESGTYMKSLMWSIFPAILFAHLRNIYSMLGFSRYALVAVVIAALLNIILNWVLIFGWWIIPPLGLFGAGIATTLVNILLCFVLIVLCYRNDEFKKYRFISNFLIFRWHLIIPIIRNGLPVSLTQVNDTLFFFVLTILVGKFGAVALAAHGISMQVLQVVFTVPNGISQATMQRVSLCKGLANGREAARQAGWAGLSLTIATVVFISLILIVYPGEVVHLMVDETIPSSQELTVTASYVIVIIGIFHLFDSGQIVLLGVLRGLKSTFYPMILATLCFWFISLPCSYYLSFYTDYEFLGIWIGVGIGLCLLCITLFGFWLVTGQLVSNYREVE